MKDLDKYTTLYGYYYTVYFILKLLLNAAENSLQQKNTEKLRFFSCDIINVHKMSGLAVSNKDLVASCAAC